MQTLVAFAFDRVPPPERVQAGLDRVEQWYARLWDGPRTGGLAAAGRLGMKLWDDPDDECRWPAWVQGDGRSVASLHVPLGYQQLIGEGPLNRAPLRLARRLEQEPRLLTRLTAPFVLAELDSQIQRLTLLTDGLGIGRLFEIRTSEGRCWSNRPVAALRFAGARAEADPMAWRQLAACGWAMADRTPYRGVRTVPAATRITVDSSGHRQQTQDALDSLVGARREPLTRESLGQTAAALLEVSRATDQLWPGIPVLGLSGGRDSRLVVAAFVAAGVEVKLKTYGAAAGEASTARLLVERLNVEVEHKVTTPSAQRRRPRRTGAYARARGWHDVTEGLRPALYLRNVPPGALLHHRQPLVCGVGGEFAHAPGYPDDVERLEQLPLNRRLDAFARSLSAKIVLPRGLAGDAVDAVDRRIREVLAHAADRGVTDSKALDWFYADERLRRWGLAGESSGRVLPLLAPEFLSAAFGLTTAESRASALHSALIGRLVPQWRDVPFYSATLRDRQSVQQQRLWQECDVEVLSGLLADPRDWGDAFDVAQVQSIWRGALAGRAAARDELLLQRVVWRAAFSDHLAAVNQESSTRPVISVGATAPAPNRSARAVAADWLSPGARVRSVATRANDIPLARRLARTGLGRHVRRRLGV